MFLKNTAYFYFILLIGLFVMSCKKAPNYPKEPSITFLSLNIVPVTVYPPNEDPLNIDSVYIAVNFQDGNGDIGATNGTEKDFLIKVYKKESGVYTYLDLGAFDFSGILPKPFSNVAGPIDGTITQVIPFDYIGDNLFMGLNKDDTLRFTVQLKDRAGNYSNIVTTSDYILWQKFNRITFPN